MTVTERFTTFRYAYFPRLAGPSARNVLFSTRNVTGAAPANMPFRLFFRDKIIHRTSVYDTRTFLNFGRNFTKPGEKRFFLSKIAHAAPSSSSGGTQPSTIVYWGAAAKTPPKISAEAQLSRHLTRLQRRPFMNCDSTPKPDK